jgi:glucosyl-3-phosphoglycerate phosphatase
VTSLIVWRHGNTEWNASGRVQGQTDTDLNDLGRQQAVDAAEQLVRMHPAAIVSSDLRRAFDTATALATLTGLSIRTDPRLRERHFGSWQGLTMAEVAERYPGEHARWRAGHDSVGCEVETLDEVAKRTADALLEAAELAPGRTVVIATHGAAARQGIGALLGWPPDALRTLRALQNCHWGELLRNDRRGWTLAAYNAGPFTERPVPPPF